MIYMYGLPGKKAYTKLDDVLKTKQLNLNEEYGFDTLKDNVDQKVKQWQNSLLSRTTTRNTIIKKNFESVSNNEENKAIMHHSMIKKSILNNKEKQLQKNINYKADETYFINAFKRSLAENSQLIRNANYCIKEIDAHFNFKKKKRNEDLLETNSDQRYPDILLKKIDEKINTNKQLYFENESLRENKVVTLNSKISIENINKRIAAFKIQNKLVEILSFLFFNNISIDRFNEDQIIFQKKPYTLEFSYEYFEAIKLNDIKKVTTFLKIDFRYLFQYDYFFQTGYHWAAKRGYKDLLNTLIEFGVHLNLLDMRGRTPLHLAAEKNNLEIVRILIEYKVNPFLLNKDNKKPVDLTTNQNIKEELREYQDSVGQMNTKNYFKSQILKYHRDNLLNGLHRLSKEKIHVKKDEDKKKKRLDIF